VTLPAEVPLQAATSPPPAEVPTAELSPPPKTTKRGRHLPWKDPDHKKAREEDDAETSNDDPASSPYGYDDDGNPMIHGPDTASASFQRTRKPTAALKDALDEEAEKLKARRIRARKELDRLYQLEAKQASERRLAGLPPLKHWIDLMDDESPARKKLIREIAIDAGGDTEEDEAPLFKLVNGRFVAVGSKQGSSQGSK
jgi:hypothetical protein